MIRYMIAFAGLVAGSLACAENVTDVDKMICAASHVQVCTEDGECYDAMPWDAGVPDFVIVDTDKDIVSTTKASGENRSTPVTESKREDGNIYLQGVEGGRAFSFVINEISGRVTVAVSLDGISVTVFGACTDADVR